MYTEKNYQTKKQIAEDIKKGVLIGCFAPGLGECPREGTIYLSGPHRLHKWHAVGTMKNGFLIKIK